jgi:hypothetical protein
MLSCHELYRILGKTFLFLTFYLYFWTHFLFQLRVQIFIQEIGLHSHIKNTISYHDMSEHIQASGLEVGRNVHLISSPKRFTLHHDKLQSSVRVMNTDRYLKPSCGELNTDKICKDHAKRMCKWCANIHPCTHFRSEVLMAVTMKTTIFWDIMPSSVIHMNQCFRETFCLHQQGRSTHDRYRFPRNVDTQ